MGRVRTHPQPGNVSEVPWHIIQTLNIWSRFLRCAPPPPPPTQERFGSSMAYNPNIKYLVPVLEVRTPPPPQPGNVSEVPWHIIQTLNIWSRFLRCAPPPPPQPRNVSEVPWHIIQTLNIWSRFLRCAPPPPPLNSGYGPEQLSKFIRVVLNTVDFKMFF